MKKILVLLSLIYFISCATEYCAQLKEVKEANDCLTSSVEKETNNCCFVTVEASGKNVNACFETDKTYTLDQIRKALTEQYKKDGQTLVDLKCPSDQGEQPTPAPTPEPTPTKSSYLKEGILLLTAFLL